MGHPYNEHKSLHTERLGKMLGGSEREKGPKAQHEQMQHAKRGGAMHADNKMHGEKAKHRLDKYKKGGKVKGKTHININVMPQGGSPAPAGPPTMPPGLAAAAMAPHPPMGPPPGAPPGPPPGAGPMMPHKSGGRTFKSGGKVGEEGGTIKKAGDAKWAESIMKGTKVQHAKQGDGVTQDKGDTNRKPVITKKHGGGVKDFSEHTKMKSIKDKDGGNGGLGRLAKARMYGGK